MTEGIDTGMTTQPEHYRELPGAGVVTRCGSIRIGEKRYLKRRAVPIEGSTIDSTRR
ncbi:hypothetical protein [Kushneria sinocarnis]|uniref:hypothetical protein n=1 Tax=Kushneria sinocarnis TaxID=595502 RepID=UPI001474077F|nr:hypothetical protein [Kushneria sinocarnis]